MILPVARNRLWNLLRDRAALVLSFVLPIVFFSIFAIIFAGRPRDETPRVRVAVADEDGSRASRRFVDALVREKALAVIRASGPPGRRRAPFTAASAEARVRAGDFRVALVIPKGFGDAPLGFAPGQARLKLRILADSSDPIAPQVLAGLVQKVAMTAMPDRMAGSGMEWLERWSGGLSPEQKAGVEKNLEALRRAGPGSGGGGDGFVEVEIRDVLGETKANPVISFYAAGLGVMFLLFSAAGAGGALIEEAESGTLDRILSTRVTMTRLLGGKLLYLVALATAQLTVMFLWGATFFGLELARHLPGFFVMTLSTALATSAFGLLLASLCRSRMQLVALSNLVILAMSALGGSMYPRFLMPEKIQKIGLVTINAWALDGFLKVFWKEEPLWRLWPQVAVLVGAAAVLFFAARRVARRWEIA